MFKLLKKTLCTILIFTIIFHYIYSLQILHLTDLHYDDAYTIGAPDNCMFVSTGMGCCRKSSIPVSPHYPAQAYGDYNCDTPINLLNYTLKWISENNNIDMIFLTGDYASHNVILQSLEENIEAGELVGGMTKLWFPNIPVVFTLGNHDTWPIDQLYPSFNGSKLSTRFTTMLRRYDWLNTDQLTEFAYGGYYKYQFGNVKILALNSLFYDSNNIFDKWRQDPEEQYKWITNEVINSYNNNEKIWIVSHINPGNSECDKKYSNLIATLCYQYPNTIQYQFYGHTHNELFQVLKYNGTNVCHSFVAPSIVPTTDIKQPQYRIYNYSKDDNIIFNYKEYYGNITTFNNVMNVSYELLYDTTSWIIPIDIFQIVDRLSNDKNFFNMFYNYYYTYSPKFSFCNTYCWYSFMNNSDIIITNNKLEYISLEIA